MAAETDKFIIASSALWAGDFEFFEALLREYSHPSEVEPICDNAKLPEDFIRATGALRLKQLWQRRGEFRKLAGKYERQGAAITDRPTIMQTKHLRATLWRTGTREFLMQGYLTELSWEDELFLRARLLAYPSEISTSKGPAQTRQTAEADDLSEEESYTPLGAAWVIADNPFIQIELTDLGLVEATGIWTGRELPGAAAAITGPFLNLLHKLDAPD